MKVFKMNEYDWVATPWDLEETIKWYTELTGTEKEEIYGDECNLEKDGCFVPVNQELERFLDRLSEVNDIKECKLNIEYVSGIISDSKFGEIRIRDGWQIYLPLKDVLEHRSTDYGPYIICSTEF
jgi:hypothetical protein